jgi:hypothetical protein
MFAEYKPLRVISLDYQGCLVTPATIAETTLRLITELLKAPHRLNNSEVHLLTRYKEHLERLLSFHVSEVTVGKHRLMFAHDREIERGLVSFRISLSKEEFGILKEALTSANAKALKFDASDIIIKYQRNFINILKADANQYSHTILFMGALQQGAYSDVVMAYSDELLYSGKALQVMPKFARELHAEYDSLLLDRIFPVDEQIQAVLDADRILMLYCQSHKVALANPDDKIDFQFYSGTTQEMFSNPDSSFAAICQPGFELLFPSQIQLQLRTFDAGVRNADKEDITEVFSAKGIGKVDEHYATTMAEIIERAPMQKSQKVPGARMLAIGRISKNEFAPEQLMQLVYERMLQDFIRAGDLAPLQESILNQFARYLRASVTVERIFGEEKYRMYNTLFHLISHERLACEDKAVEVRKLCRASLAVREICAEIYMTTPKLAAFAMPVAGGAGRVAAVFAGSAGAAGGAASVTKSAESLKVMKVLDYLLSNIVGGALKSIVGKSVIQFNAKQYRVPEIIGKLLDIVISEKPVSSKLSEIILILAEKPSAGSYSAELLAIVQDSSSAEEMSTSAAPRP